MVYNICIVLQLLNYFSMNFKVIKPFNLIQVNRDNRHSLYKLVTDRQDFCYKLIPISFAQNQPFLRIDKSSRLIITADAVYSFDSLKYDIPALACIPGKDIQIIKMAQFHDSLSRFLIVYNENGGNKSGFENYGNKEILLWDKDNVLLHKNCLDFCYTSEWLAVKENSGWQIFDSNGKRLMKHVLLPTDGEVALSAHFVKFSNMCSTALYSIKTGKLICGNKLLIKNSQTENFALCASITDKKTDVYFKGKWSTIENIDGFGIVADASHVFYVVRNKKYFLYAFCGEPLFGTDFPEGVDSVAYDNETSSLMIVNDSCVHFFKNE